MGKLQSMVLLVVKKWFFGVFLNGFFKFDICVFMFWSFQVIYLVSVESIGNYREYKEKMEMKNLISIIEQIDFQQVGLKFFKGEEKLVFGNVGYVRNML